MAKNDLPAPQRVGDDARPELSASEHATTKNAIRKKSLVAHRLTAEERHARISIVAYHKAATRGFEPGSEVDDWLSAEQEIDSNEDVERGD